MKYTKISMFIFAMALLIIAESPAKTMFSKDKNGMLHIPQTDGTTLLVEAAVDDDGDNIDNELEINGFIVDGDSLLPWDGDTTKIYYITDWRRASTDGDPYNDYTEAVGVGLPAGVFPPEDHPLVAARPRISVRMTSYDVHPLVTITDSQGGSQGTAYTNGVSNSTTVGVEVTEGAEFGSAGFNANVSVTGSYSETQTFTQSTTSSSEMNWNNARSTQPDKAARLELQIYMENIGSVTALDVSPTVNLKLGDKVIETFSLPQAESLTPFGTTTSRFPESGTINVGLANGNEITLTLDELKAIQLGTPLTLEVIQVSANVVSIDENNNSVNKSWNGYISEIELVSVDIIANIGSDDYRRHQVFAGWTRWDPEYSFRDLLARIFDVKNVNGSIMIEERTYPDEWYASTSSEKVIDEWEMNGRPDNILGMRMYPNTQIIMSSPGDDAKPVVNLASYSRFESDTTVSTAYSRVLVSAVPNRFPISLVTAEIPVNGEVKIDTLKQNKYGFYVNEDAFANTPEGPGTVFVRNARGEVTERTISAPAIYTSAADVKKYSHFHPNPGADYWIYPDGDQTRPMLLYCLFNDMKTGDTLTAPREYLSLNTGSSSSNFSEFAYDGGTTRMNFSKIRFDPSKLSIDTKDTTFVNFPGSKRISFLPPYFNQLGFYGKIYYNPAFDTVAARIDLRGTPFYLSPTTLFTADAHDHISVDKSRKIMDVKVAPFPGEFYVEQGNAGITTDTLRVMYGTYEPTAQDVQISGSAVRFNDQAEDGNINMGSSEALRVTDQLTLEAWIYPTASGADSINGGVIVNKEGEYQIARFADGSIRWTLAVREPYWTWVNTGYMAPENEWTHVALVFDSGLEQANTYINGSLFHSIAAVDSIADQHPNENEFRVGARQNINNSRIRFQGIIDEVRVWNVARSEAQIQSTMGAALPEIYYASEDSGLVGYWKMDALTDLGVGVPGVNDVRDYSIHQNHGDAEGDVSLNNFSVDIADEDAIKPENFSLRQNYPNPFNPLTTIQYELPVFSNIKLTIYNLKGQAVRELVNLEQDAGSYQVQWDGTSDAGFDVASGVYFYRIRAGNFRETRKMLLLH